MSAETLRQAAAAIRQDCPLPEDSRAIDFIDFPAAWALQNEGSTAHGVRCSATQTGGAMLCDCEALLPPWVKWKTLLAVADWLDATAAENDSPDDSGLHRRGDVPPRTQRRDRVAAVTCDVCNGTGVIRAARNRDGIWEGDDCWGCNGTGDADHFDDSPYNTANYATNRDSA